MAVSIIFAFLMSEAKTLEASCWLCLTAKKKGLGGGMFNLKSRTVSLLFADLSLMHSEL